MVTVRMEAIGGQGANSAGKILSEAAVLGMHYTGNHFSSFGSEKRGTPVRSFVRFSPERKPVRSTSFISEPHLLMIFHESSIRTRSEVVSGIGENTDIVVNSESPPELIGLPKNSRARNIIAVNATEIARRSQCGLNVVMLGAAIGCLPEIEVEILRSAIESFFSKLSTTALKANLNGFKEGQRRARQAPFTPLQAQHSFDAEALPRLGWQNAPIGGLIINPGNSVLKDNSVSRKGVAPRFLLELCFHCGYCDMVCPDFCFVWEKPQESERSNAAPELKGIDYQFCKGCQKCISICPVNALVPVLESEIKPEERLTRLFPRVTPEAVQAQWQSAVPREELLDLKNYIKPDFSQAKIPGKKS